MSEQKLQVYGAGWCTKTSFINNLLQAEWVAFDYFNVEEDEQAANRVRALYDGVLKFPTVVYGEEHLKNPKPPGLMAFLRKHGLLG